MPVNNGRPGHKSNTIEASWPDRSHCNLISECGSFVFNGIDVELIGINFNKHSVKLRRGSAINITRRLNINEGKKNSKLRKIYEYWYVLRTLSYTLEYLVDGKITSGKKCDPISGPCVRGLFFLPEFGNSEYCCGYWDNLTRLVNKVYLRKLMRLLW